MSCWVDNTMQQRWMEENRFLPLPAMPQTLTGVGLGVGVGVGGPSGTAAQHHGCPSGFTREMNFNYKAPSYRQHTAPL